MRTHRVLWSVSLSNGETIHEEKGEYKSREGVPSPWCRLMAYIDECDVQITSLSLYTDEGHRFNLPSLGSNPRFKAFANAEKPVSFRMFRKLGADVMGKNIVSQDLYTVIEATYADSKVLQLWVDERTFSVWTLII